MKRRFLAVFLALALCVGLLPPLIQEASAKEPQYEQAWYPAAHMYVVQIAYESASHSGRNTFDIANIKGLSKNDQRIFAPFTGIIVHNDTQSNYPKGYGRYGYVLLQSVDKVRYADGTIDYMTVGFMHDENISDLPEGKVIKQGELFYDHGGMNNGKEKFSKHVQISVFKGQFFSVTPNSDGSSYTVGKRLRTFNKVNKKENKSHGDIYAFDAFFVNTNKTTVSQSTAVGAVYKENTLSNKNAPSDWSGKWKDLNGNPFPALPTISGSNAPSTLKVGGVFSIKGTVSSKTKLLSVTAGVYTAETGGTMKTGKTVYPSKPYHNTTVVRSYDLSKLASSVQFNKLPAGTYWYRVTAKNGGGTVTLVNKKFTVGNAAAATLPIISGANAPDTLQTGDSFSVQGTISSSTKITSVTAGVYTAGSGGTAKISKTVNPNDTSYSLSKLASSIQFSNLPAGTYWYQVTAKNSAGTGTLINKKFTVKDPSAQAAPKAAILTPGWYTLAPACAPGLRLDVAYSGASSEDPVWTWEANGSNAQAWYLLPYSMTVGHYHLAAGTNKETEMVLDVQYGGTTSGTEVWLYEANDTPAQEWIFLDAGGGYYYIVPCENQSLALAVKGGSSDEGSSIIVETRNGSLGQKWKLTKY